MTAPSINTPHAIIKDAAEDAALLQEGQDLTPDQYARYLRRLNDLVNLWQTQGLKLWLWQDVEVPLTASDGQYTIGSGGDVNIERPLRIESAYFIDQDADSRRPINVLSWNEWTSLGNVTTTGPVVSIFQNKQQSFIYINTWQIPDATAAAGELHCVLRYQVTNPISLIETMNFPVEWRIGLRWGLAAEICTNQPQAVIERCESRARTYRQMLEDWDNEAPAETRFTPDTQYQGATGGSRFS